MGNAQLVEGIYDSFAMGDVPAILAVLDPEVEWSFAESHPFNPGRPLVGPDEVVQKAFGRIAAETENFTVTPANFVDGGDTVVMEGRYRGVWKSTGRSFDAQVAHIWRLRRGKVVSVQQYVDTDQFQKVSS